MDEQGRRRTDKEGNRNNNGGATSLVNYIRTFELILDTEHEDERVPDTTNNIIMNTSNISTRVKVKHKTKPKNQKHYSSTQTLDVQHNTTQHNAATRMYAQCACVRVCEGNIKHEKEIVRTRKRKRKRKKVDK